MNMNIVEIALGITAIGGAITIIIKFINPIAIEKRKLDSLEIRVITLERHDMEKYERIGIAEHSNRLLCRAMVELVNNRITNNNIEGLKKVQADLLDFLQNGGSNLNGR